MCAASARAGRTRSQARQQRRVSQRGAAAQQRRLAPAAVGRAELVGVARLIEEGAVVRSGPGVA